MELLNLKHSQVDFGSMSQNMSFKIYLFFIYKFVVKVISFDFYF